MAKDLKKLAKVLRSAGHFDANLTLAIAKSFLRCQCPDIYKTKMLQVQIVVQDAIKYCAYMNDDRNRMAYMKRMKVDFASVCDTAIEEYGLAFGDGEWGPSKLPKDTTQPPAAYVSMLGDFQKKMLTLIQNKQPYSAGNRSSDVTCYNCGKKGHISRNCPSNKRQNRPNNDAKTTKMSWKRQKPSSGAAETKVVDNTTYHWCAKCRRWNTTHTTSQHAPGKGKRGGKPAGQAPGASANHLSIDFDPGAWCFYTTPPDPLDTFVPNFAAHHRKQQFWIPLLRLTYLIVTAAHLASLWLPYVVESAIPAFHHLLLRLPEITDVFRSFWAYYAPAIAPTTWFIAGMLALHAKSKPYVPSTLDLTRSKPSRCNRRKHTKPRRRLFSARDHRLHKSYPHRLKTANKFVTRAPTIAEREKTRNAEAYIILKSVYMCPLAIKVTM